MPKASSRWILLAIAACLAMPHAARAQKDTTKKKEKKAPEKLATAFFDSETPLDVTLTTNVRRIRSDKGQNSPTRPATWTFAGADGKPVTIPIKIHTRGIWRLKTCEYPPIRLNFTNDETKRTVFHGLDKPKLVNFCRDNDTYEQYLLQEFMLYRVQQLLTPYAHKVRLLRVTYADSGSTDPKPVAIRYAFIQEEPDAMAARLKGIQLKSKGALPGDFEPKADAIFGLFEYMIGNTDFGQGALHNVEIVGFPDGTAVPIAYDFDFSGAVNARYATVDPSLKMNNVRERRFRGYCVPEDTWPAVFKLFNEKKDAMYALYKDDLGKLLKPGIVDETLKYFDEFYKTINNPRDAKAAIIDACLGKLKK